jgi:hypothetical protein
MVVTEQEQEQEQENEELDDYPAYLDHGVDVYPHELPEEPFHVHFM